MRALRHWIHTVRCRGKYGKACPHAGRHEPGSRRASSSHSRKAQPVPRSRRHKIKKRKIASMTPRA